MNRVLIYLDKHGNTVAVRQRLSKRPDGNAFQRAKQIRSGRKPEWINAERPHILEHGVVVLGSKNFVMLREEE